MGKIILIAGGAGFLGTNLIKYILKRYPEYKIINFDKLTQSGYYYDYVMNENNYIFYYGDVASYKDIRNVFDEYRPEIIINCANESHIENSLAETPKHLETNIRGTQNLLGCAKEFDVGRFIQISTAKVYGSGKFKERISDLSSTDGIDEESNLVPRTSFAASKASSDLFVLSSLQNYELPANIIRFTNNYGPYQFPEKLIPSLILNTLRFNDVPIYGDGSKRHDWLYIEDTCKAIDLVLHKGKTGEIYNVSSNEVFSNIDIARIILETLGSPQDLIEFLKERPIEDIYYPINSEKIRRTLGWKNDYNFREGLKMTINWMKDNEEWVNSIITGSYKKINKDRFSEMGD